MSLHHPGNIFVYICMYSTYSIYITQHLDRFYGCCCENTGCFFDIHTSPSGGNKNPSLPFSLAEGRGEKEGGGQQVSHASVTNLCQN